MRFISVDANCELPSVEITDCRYNGLRCLRSGNQEFGARRGGDVKHQRKEIRSFVKSGENERV
jgi:hypothetical protein